MINKSIHLIIVFIAIISLFASVSIADESNLSGHSDEFTGKVRETVATIEMPEQELMTVETKKRIAIMPFENFSGNYGAFEKVMPLVEIHLKGKGYNVLDYKVVEDFLCEKRIREESFISRETARELGRNKKVTSIMVGAVLTFIEDGNPKIGMLARLISLSTGDIIWSNFVSITGEDYTKVLGLGTIKSIDRLLPRALNNLFGTLGSPLHNKDSKDTYKIAVLPFKNESGHRHAGMIVTHLFQNEFSTNPLFSPVDFGEIKKNIVDLRMRHKGEIDYNNLQALSKSLGVDMVLTGTVEKYSAGKEYSSPPVVTISARLLDSRMNRILWYDNIQLDGEKNIIALDWGRLRSADKVAFSAISSLVEQMKSEGLQR